MKQQCNQCGDSLIGGSVGNRCPNCLLALALADPDDDPPEDPFHLLAPGERFGGYELLEEIARGGMGVVYKARQLDLNRVVALKLILSGRLASRQEVLRFRAEAEAVASLRHPNIVAIYETGEEGGQHFFSMEYVEGQNLAEIVRLAPLSAERAAAYCETIARAIQHAHDQGTLHRDLKPSNVLIDLTDRVRITDFGLARGLRRDSELTVTGQMLGSPSFMPPEQASAKHAAVGPACDVYGIGAILYHLITGRPPFEGETMAEVVRQLHEQDPVPPRMLVANIPRDLQTVALKCLEKDPAKRYSSTGQMADELGRFLRHEPVQARPVGSAERVWRWCRRKPAFAALLGALCLAISAGVGGVVWQWREATESARALRHGLYSADINLASHLRSDRDINRTANLLSRHIPRPGEEDLRGFEWYLLWASCRGEASESIEAHDGDVRSIAVTPSGDSCLTTGGDRTVKLWDLRTLKLDRILKSGVGVPSLHSLAMSPDGALAAACDGVSLTVWKTKDWALVVSISNAASVISFSPNRGALATSAGDGIQLWNPTTWVPESFVEGPLELFRFDPKGGVLAVARKEHIDLHDATTGALLRRLPERIEDHAYALVFSPDGRFLAAGGMYGGVVVWDVTDGQVVARIKSHTSFVSGLAFSPDGTWLATGGSDQFLTLTRVRDWQKEAELTGHKNGVFDLAFTPDGRRLISASRDQTVRFWKIPPQPKEEMLGDAQSLIGFLPDSRSAVTLDSDSTVRTWDVKSLQETARIKSTAQSKATSGNVSPDGTVAAIGFEDGSVELIRLRTGERLHRASGGTNAIFSLHFSPDGKLVASIGVSVQGAPTANGILKVLEVSGGSENTSLGSRLGGWASGVAFSRDGRWLAIGLPDYSIQIWDRTALKPLHTLTGHTWDVSSVAFSPDDRTLVSSSWDTSVRLWDVTSGREQARFSGLPVGAGPATFSPDGLTLAASFVGNAIQLWHVANQQELLSLKWSGSFLGPLIFSPDGRTLGSGRLIPVSPDGGARLWRAPLLDPADLSNR